MELSFCQKKTYIFVTLSCRTKIFQTINSVRSNIQSKKYQTFILLGFKDIGIRKFEFVEKTQFLCI